MNKDNQVNVDVSFARNVDITINDLQNYEALVKKRVANATRELREMQEANEDEKRQLRAELADLKAKLISPETAFREHKERETQIENLLQDQATAMAIGQNRIHSALKAFKYLQYDEVDGLLAECEDRGNILAARSAYGRGLVAEDAVKYRDAALHYTRSVNIKPSYSRYFRARLCLWRSGNYLEAKKLGDDFVRWARRHGEAMEYPKALNEHGLTLWSLEEFEESERLFRTALELVPDIQKNHEISADLANNLALVLEEQGELIEAAQLFRKSLQLDQEMPGGDSLDFSVTLTNLGRILRKQGNLVEAEATILNAIAVAKPLLGQEHPIFAVYLDNLAILRLYQGRNEDAVKIFTEMLSIDEETIGTMHPDFAKHCYGMAQALIKLGRESEAIPYLKKSLVAYKSGFPQGHTNIPIISAMVGDLRNQ